MLKTLIIHNNVYNFMLKLICLKLQLIAICGWSL